MASAEKPVPERHTAIAANVDALPNFARPPVDEVALSYQFAPIQGFGMPHFGLYWQRIRATFPRFEVKAPIESQAESASLHVQGKPTITLVDTPEARCWFLDSSGNQIVQVQQTRFVHNWRKLSGSEPYPRYPTLRARLETEWETFCAFLKEEKLERPRIAQCEVVYLNHIEYGVGWSGYGELDNVMRILAIPREKGRFLPAPERASMNVIYPFPDGRGRLYVSFVPVIRGRDGQEVLQLAMTARRSLQPTDGDAEALAALDFGRKWIVKGFMDFTTEAMHKIWGKQQ